MANNTYTGNWAGAMTPQPSVNNSNNSFSQSQVNNNFDNQNVQPNFPMNMGMPLFIQNGNSLIIVPVQSNEAAQNYIVGPGVTAFLINYSDRVFWTKRQTDNGLGYDMVKHHFSREDEQSTQTVTQKTEYVDRNSFGRLSDDFVGLREEFYKLKQEFNDFMM